MLYRNAKKISLINLC